MFNVLTAVAVVDCVELKIDKIIIRANSTHGKVYSPFVDRFRRK